MSNPAISVISAINKIPDLEAQIAALAAENERLKALLKPTMFYCEALEEGSYPSLEKLVSELNWFSKFDEPVVLEVETLCAGPTIYAAIQPLEEGGYIIEKCDSPESAEAVLNHGRNEVTNEEREALIAQGWTPPKAVDPDLGWAELIAKEMYEVDDATFRNAAFIGIKRGRALAATEAKPGLVWKKHDGWEECPMDPTDAVMVRYGGGTCAYKVMARLIHDWENVTHYIEITKPNDAAQ